MTKWIPHPLYVETSNISKLTSYKKFLKRYKLPDNEDERNKYKDKFDIALIKVSPPFTRHKNDGRNYQINTICLPERDPNLYSPGNATFFGYGGIDHWSKINYVFSVSSDYLLKGDLHINSFYWCYQMFYCAHWEGDEGGGRPCPVSQSNIYSLFNSSGI